MKRVLLTGASGFIGRHCIGGLLARGYEVHAVSAHQGATCTKVQWHKADLLDQAEIKRLVAQVRPAALLHLAWYAVPGKYWTARENLEWLQSGIGLLLAFADNGGERAVVAGTCAEYDARFGLCCEDLTPIRPGSLYGTCKNALRLVAEQLAAHSGTSLAWGRIFHLYGPYEPASRFVPSLICHLLRGQNLACSDGKQVRDYSHVQDIAHALVALLASEVQGEVNIASGQPISLRALGKLIESAIGRHDLVQWGALATAPEDPPLLVANTHRLNHEVGWQPKFSPRLGVIDAINWWRDRL